GTVMTKLTSCSLVLICSSERCKYLRPLAPVAPITIFIDNRRLLVSARDRRAVYAIPHKAFRFLCAAQPMFCDRSSPRTSQFSPAASALPGFDGKSMPLESPHRGLRLPRL